MFLLKEKSHQILSMQAHDKTNAFITRLFLTFCRVQKSLGPGNLIRAAREEEMIDRCISRKAEVRWVLPTLVELH